MISTDLFFRPAIKIKPKPQIIDNGDFFLIRKRLMELAEKKAIQVTEVITSPRTDRLLKRVSFAGIITLGGIMAIHFILLYFKG